MFLFFVVVLVLFFNDNNKIIIITILSNVPDHIYEWDLHMGMVPLVVLVRDLATYFVH